MAHLNLVGSSCLGEEGVQIPHPHAQQLIAQLEPPDVAARRALHPVAHYCSAVAWSAVIIIRIILSAAKNEWLRRVGVWRSGLWQHQWG